MVMLCAGSKKEIIYGSLPGLAHVDGRGTVAQIFEHLGGSGSGSIGIRHGTSCATVVLLQLCG